MTADKITVSLDPELATRIREAARKGGTSVSAWLAEAAEAKLRSEGLRDFLDDWAAEHGPITAEELARAEAELGLRPPSHAA